MPIRLKISASCNGQPPIEQDRADFIISNKQRLIALDFIGASFISEFFRRTNIKSSFNRLESVVLRQIRQSDLLKIVDFLNSSPRLSSLNIQLKNNSRYVLGNIYPIVFLLHTVKCLKISLSHRNRYNSWIPMIVNETPINITRMVLNHYCTFHDLISILRNTPSLSHLTCHHLSGRRQHMVQETPVRLSSLRHLTFRKLTAKFDELERFFEAIICPLKVLLVTTHSYLSYLNGDRWKELIEKRMPHLCQFHVNYRVSFHRNIPLAIDHQAISQFTSSFWIERLWDFKIKRVADDLICSIHPHRCIKINLSLSNRQPSFLCRDTWYTHYLYDRMLRNERITENSQAEFISPMQLIFHRCLLNEQSCCQAMEFTYLNIRCSTISICMLIKILNVLPQVDSLELSSLLLVGTDCLLTEDQERFSLASIGKTITTVTLSEVDGIDQAKFFMNLCPRMEYLTIEGLLRKNTLMKLIESISLNNTTNTRCLKCLWICVTNANDDTAQFIEDMVDFERFFHGDQTFRDYVVGQIGDEIYCTWKV
jgi:hypothetical protein